MSKYLTHCFHVSCIYPKDAIDVKAQITNKFWQEVMNFQTKTGPFLGRSAFHHTQHDLFAGTSYFWHKKETCRRTEVLGRLAARVSSKILGIGSAKRSWGDVKQLKSGKRSHLSADKVKKQATIFGASAMRIARSKRKVTIGTMKTKYALAEKWFDDDLEETLKLINPTPVVTAPVRTQYFRAWMDPDDVVKRYINDTVAMYSILQKYGNLCWIDGEKKFRSDKDKMRWNRVTKNNGGGWYLIAYDDECYVPSQTYDENRDAGGIEETPITLDLISNIAEYHKSHPELDVIVVDDDAPADDVNVEQNKEK
jgi:hypothetical protein